MDKPKKKGERGDKSDITPESDKKLHQILLKVGLKTYTLSEEKSKNNGK